jgi:hypothetical protein
MDSGMQGMRLTHVILDEAAAVGEQPQRLTAAQKGKLAAVWEDLEKVGGDAQGNRQQRRAAERVYRKHGVPMPGR